MRTLLENAKCRLAHFVAPGPRPVRSHWEYHDDAVTYMINSVKLSLVLED